MKSRLLKLSLSLALVVAATLAGAPKVESACIAICDFSRSCCCGKVAGIDHCTGAKVCVSQCAF